MPLLLCPNCESGMQQVNRDGVQIDVCSQCRGVWLDRGELEKLLGSVKEVESERELDQETYYREQYSGHPGGGKHGYDPYSGKKGHYRKKSAFERLSDIFD